jgi:hypothetical protein
MSVQVYSVTAATICPVCCRDVDKNVFVDSFHITHKISRIKALNLRHFIYLVFENSVKGTSPAICQRLKITVVLQQQTF